MKKAVKILTFVLVFALALMPLVTLAAPPKIDMTGQDGGALPAEAKTAIGSVLGIIQFIGYAVALVMILVLGVQWMLATPAKKAELKGKMWSMAIGILLLVGGVSILNWVWTLSENATKAAGK